MEDLSALATRICVAFDGLRGCLILSRDGLVLGLYPSDAEVTVKPQWLRLAQLGDMEKGFCEFGDEMWVYVRRGPYAAFALGDRTIRPGLMIDQLEQALFTAEEQRSKREALKIPEAPAAPSGRPRTSLHKEPAKPAPQPVAAEPAPPAAAEQAAPAAAQPAAPEPERPAAAPPAENIPDQPASAPVAQAPAPPQAAPAPQVPAPTEAAPAAQAAPIAEAAPAQPAPAATPEPAVAPGADTAAKDDEDEGGEVDRVLLAQEFSRLLQESGPDDEDNG
jgi:hypothetical protein